MRFFNEGQEPAPCPFSVRARGDVDVLAIHRNDLKRLIDSDRVRRGAARVFAHPPHPPSDSTRAIA